MSRPAPEEFECDHLLIVEGYSDLHFYAAMLHHLRRSKGVFIKAFNGKSPILNQQTLMDYLEPRLDKKKSIGILLDADNSPAGTTEAIRQHFKAITSRDVIEGEWNEEEGNVRLGFFVAPDKATAGEIETLVWRAFPDEQYALMKQTVDEFHAKMASLTPQWKSHSPDKGRIGAYLSAAYDEDPRLGPGAREKKFDFDAPGFARLRAFLEILPMEVEFGDRTSSSGV